MHDSSLYVRPAWPTHPLWMGSDTRLFAAALQLREEQSWLKEYFPDPDSEAFYFWVVNSGVRDFGDRVKRWLPPIPNAERQRAISNSEDLEAFLNGGTSSAEGLLRLLAATGVDPFQARRILDFGCGCARVLRHLIPLSRRSELWGCDIDSEAIAFCRESIGAARFFANRAEPPLPVADAAFDLVFSISVFTHLGSGLRDAWMRELRRIVPPGGFVAFSVHGELAWRKVVTDREFQKSIAVRPRDVDAAAGDWDASGVVFVPHLVPKSYDHQEPYGLVFFRQDLLPSLCPGFEMLRYEPGALGGWQDLVLLRRCD